MEKDIKELIQQRIKQNKKLFTDIEYSDIISNINICVKIYLLGIIDAKKITLF